MAQRPLFDGSQDHLTPAPEISRWLSADRPLQMRVMALGMVNPGMFVFALAYWPEFQLGRSDLAQFLSVGQKRQLAQLGLPPVPAVARLLSKLKIQRIESLQETDEVRSWIQKTSGRLPKVLLHTPVVHWSYIRALARQPWLAQIPYPVSMGIDPDGIGNMEHLEEVLSSFLEESAALGWSDHARRQALGNVRYVEHLEDLVEFLRRDTLQIPVRLEPDSHIWIPTSYRDFQWLARHQQNCVDRYFSQAAKGKCQIVAVGTGKQLDLTAELQLGRDGFWYPTQVLAHKNRLARHRDIARLLHWLATAQARLSDDFCYRRNLVRLMAWASSRAVDKVPNTTAEAHWFLMVEVLAQLLHDQQSSRASAQLSLPLAVSEPVASKDAQIC